MRTTQFLGYTRKQGLRVKETGTVYDKYSKEGPVTHIDIGNYRARLTESKATRLNLDPVNVRVTMEYGCEGTVDISTEDALQNLIKFRLLKGIADKKGLSSYVDFYEHIIVEADINSREIADRLFSVLSLYATARGDVSERLANRTEESIKKNIKKELEKLVK